MLLKQKTTKHLFKMERFFEKILLIGQIKSFEVYLSDFCKEVDESNPNEKWRAITQRFKDSLIVLNNASRMINYLEEENDNLKKMCKFTEDLENTLYKLENFERLRDENERLKNNIL